MSESALLREANLKENVEVIDGGFLARASFTRGTLTVFRKGFPEDRLREAMVQIGVADVKSFKEVAAPEPPGFGLLGRFGMLGAAVSAGWATGDSGKRQKYARIELKGGDILTVRADPVRMDMIANQWKVPRR